MFNCDSVIRELEQHNSRLDKEAILKSAADSNNLEFFEGCRLALTPTVTFGVKKVPTHGGPDGQGLPWAAFAKLADQLQKRELTGHDARDAIELSMSVAKQAQWNDWYRRILIKDLRCGVSEKTVNKVLKSSKIAKVPVFTCQLAHDGANHPEKVTGKKLIEVKLDGVRVLTVVYPNGRVDQFSRNGKELVNFEHIKKQFKQISNGLTQPYVFDGEVMSSSFQDLMKQVHRKSNVAAQDAVLYLFDIVPLDKFQKAQWKLSQQERSDMLRNWYVENNLGNVMPNIRILEQELVDLDTEQGQEEFKAINQQAISGGYEGIMIKDPSAAYECKRSTAWLKQKPFIEVTLEVVNVEEGTGRNLGRLGAFICRGQDDGKDITVNVGSGFSDSDRSEFWLRRDSVIGQLVEVRADAVTKNQDGSYSLRFPRFIRFRGFVAGEKL